MESISLLLLSLVLISICFSGANFLGWQLFERPPHALIWAFAYLLAALQYSFNLLRDFLPGEQVYWLLANSTSFALVICAVWGHRERLSLPTPRALMWLPWGILTAVSLYVVAVAPHQGLRTALAPGFSFCCMSFIAWLLVTRGERPRLAQHVAAAVHFLFGLTQGASAAIALGFGVSASPALQQAYYWANFALMPSLFVAMGVSVIFLLATDLSAQLRRLAHTDTLTGISNRRGFLELSLRVLARSRRSQRPLSLIVCDLDHFKRVNDSYGHATGDRAIRHFAATLGECVRPGDVVGRIGGEEFCVCLQDMNLEQAEVVAARIRRRLAERPLPLEAGSLELTASYGVSVRREDDDIDSLLQRADQALYQAKRAGRDTILVARMGGVAAVA